jgi:hypothetical protein
LLFSIWPFHTLFLQPDIYRTAMPQPRTIQSAFESFFVSSLHDRRGPIVTLSRCEGSSCPSIAWCSPFRRPPRRVDSSRSRQAGLSISRSPCNQPPKSHVIPLLLPLGVGNSYQFSCPLYPDGGGELCNELQRLLLLSGLALAIMEARCLARCKRRVPQDPDALSSWPGWLMKFVGSLT